MSPVDLPKLAPPATDHPWLRRLITVKSPPSKLVSSDDSLDHSASTLPRSAGLWLYTVTCRPLLTSVTTSGMYESVGTAMFRGPMFRWVGRCVYDPETTTFHGSWCWSSTLNSVEYGHARFGSKRLFWPKLKPLDGPSSLSCGSRSPFRSQAVVCPGAHVVHTRVSLVAPSGFSLSTPLRVIGTS